MKPNFLSNAFLTTALMALVSAGHAGAQQNATDALELARSTYKLDRQAFLADALTLTDTESAAFWPLYRSYRTETDKLGDSLVKLVLEYKDLYPNLPEDRAGKLLKQYMSLEESLVSKRQWYYKRAGNILPASKVLRWAQLENRLDLVLRLQLASIIPLAPASSVKP